MAQAIIILAIRVVRFAIRDYNYRMQSPSFIITNKILSSISKIEAAEEVIKHAPLLPLWEKQFKEDAVVRAVYHGTHLEGNQLQKDEAKDVLMGKDVVARPRDIQEIINYRKVIEQVVVKNSQTGEVTFTPPSAIDVPFLMREFTYWLNRDSTTELHPVLKAGIAHHELVRIHPFVDGNGRVARVLATLIMLLGGYDIRRFFSLEEYYDKDSHSYYENLQKASAGDLTAWLEYFTWGAAIEFDKVKEKVLKLSRDVKMKERFGGKQIYLNDRQVKLVEYIQEVGYLQNQSFGTVIQDVSEDTILRDIQDLIKKDLIKKVGSTKAARYVMV